MGTKTSSMTTGQRMTRSKTSSASQPSVSTASSECDKDIQVLGEKRQKYTISHLVNLNNGLMVLRQIANHPYLVMDFRDRESDSALDSAHLLPTCGTDLIFASEKTKLLDRLLTVLINTKHKVSMMKLVILVSHYVICLGDRINITVIIVGFGCLESYFMCMGLKLSRYQIDSRLCSGVAGIEVRLQFLTVDFRYIFLSDCW